MIRKNGEDSNMVEFIRNNAGSAIGIDHKKIFEAIASRDEISAREIMTQHLNNILADMDVFKND